MDEIEEYKEGLHYKEEVRDAVRFGYQYRLETEDDGSINYCLPDASDILLWIANMILGGLAWDKLKLLVNKLRYTVIDTKLPIDEETKSVLTEELELKKFYTYVKEFNEQSMSVTAKQFKYIREEIVADYCGKECGKIYNREHRLPTIEEYIRINREANERADRLMTLKS